MRVVLSLVEVRNENKGLMECRRFKKKKKSVFERIVVRVWTVCLSGSDEVVLLRVSVVFEDKNKRLVGEECVVGQRGQSMTIWGR